MKRLSWAVLAVFVLAVTCLLPLVVHDDAYGDVPIPGSGTVHLPAGDVDVTLRSQRSRSDADAVPVPPLSMYISAPAGSPPPEVIESRRAKCVTNDCDVQTRIWMVRILREGDYRVTIDGEVYGPYQPTLTLGHVVWNDGVLALLAVGAVIRWTLLCAFGVAAVLWLCVAVLPRTTKQAPNAAGQPTVEQRNLPRAEQLPPAQELVLPYPDPRGRVGRFIFFVVLWLLLVGGPVAGTYSWFHLPGGAPVSWIPVVVLAGFGVGFGWLLSRVVIR